MSATDRLRLFAHAAASNFVHRRPAAGRFAKLRELPSAIDPGTGAPVIGVAADSGHLRGQHYDVARDPYAHRPSPNAIIRTPTANDADSGELQWLRVLSLNTWCSHFLGGPARAERLQLLLDHVEQAADYDVLVLQELFTFGAGRVVRCPRLQLGPPACACWLQLVPNRSLGPRRSSCRPS